MSGSSDGETKTAFTFEINCARILDADGTLVAPLADNAQDCKTLTGLHKDRVLTRAFDAKAISLQRTGHLGKEASCGPFQAASDPSATAPFPDLRPSCCEGRRGGTLLRRHRRRPGKARMKSRAT